MVVSVCSGYIAVSSRVRLMFSTDLTKSYLRAVRSCLFMINLPSGFLTSQTIVCWYCVRVQYCLCFCLYIATVRFVLVGFSAVATSSNKILKILPISMKDCWMIITRMCILPLTSRRRQADCMHIKHTCRMIVLVCVYVLANNMCVAPSKLFLI